MYVMWYFYTILTVLFGVRFRIVKVYYGASQYFRFCRMCASSDATFFRRDSAFRQIRIGIFLHIHPVKVGFHPSLTRFRRFYPPSSQPEEEPPLGMIL